MLAVHFLPSRTPAAPRCTWCTRSRSQKPKGAKPGLVTLAGGKRVTVRMDGERLKALLATQGHQGENPRGKS
ncbi:MAG: hypothetical protein R3F17_05040 [Planctomycetota bacterium]